MPPLSLTCESICFERGVSPHVMICVVINYCFFAIIFCKAVNKQHPSNEELLSMTEFFKGELLGFDHLPRYHLVSDVFLQ